MILAEPAREQRPRAWAFGPGLVHMLGSFGVSDLIANSVIGATYGYTLLWTLAVAYSLNFCIAEAFSRYVLATGESIMEGFGRLGRPVVIVLAVAIFVRRHLNNLAYSLLLGTTLHLLVPLPTPWSPVIWSLLSVTVALLLMVRGGYQGVELVCRGLLVLLAGSLVVVVILSRPALPPILEGLLAPSFPANEGFYGHILLLMSITGTTVGSINHLKYPAYIYEKGWRDAGDLPKQRVDLVLSVAGQFLIAVLIQVAAAAALHGQNVQIRTVADLASVFSVPLGEAGRVVLALGVWATVFPGYLGSNTGYSLIVADAYERFLRKGRGSSLGSRDAVRRRAYRALLVFFCLTPLYGVFTTWEPLLLVLIAGAMFVVLTPLVMTGLLILTTNRSLMRDYVSPLASRAGIGVAILISLYLTYQSAVRLMAQAANL